MVGSVVCAAVAATVQTAVAETASKTTKASVAETTSKATKTAVAEAVTIATTETAEAKAAMGESSVCRSKGNGEYGEAKLENDIINKEKHVLAGLPG